MKPSFHKTKVSFTAEVEVEFNFHPGCKGARDGLGGPPIEPDEPDSVEIIRARLNGTEIELDYQQIQEIEPELFSHVSDCDDAAAEDKADAEREERRIEGVL